MAKGFLLVVALAVVLAGCGSTTGPATTSSVVPDPTAIPTLAVGDTHTRGRDGMVMVFVPAGEFLMGSSDAEVDEAMRLCREAFGEEFEDCIQVFFADEQPAHTVAMDAFWIDRTEVTNAQFALFLNEQGNQLEGEGAWLELEDESCLIEQVGGRFRPKSGYGNYPVIEVSWYGARAYCEWAGGRLPTEAEWEYAARGPDGRVYPWGDTFDRERLNYCDARCALDWKDSAYNDGYGGPAPVGNYLSGASWCNALDMAGNAWEWVSDWYGDTYYAFSAMRNPTGPDNGTWKAVRGGGWGTRWDLMRTASREYAAPSASNGYLGFRCVLLPGD